MYGKINRRQILTSHRRIREDYFFRMRQSLSEDTKRHLQRGLLSRLGMVEAAIIILDDEISETQSPMDHYLAEKLALFLNAYYLNLAGSLDNLAWALTYHHNLIPNVNEADLKHRRFAQLLTKAFLIELRQNNLDPLADALEPFRDWYQDMREFRDPAAHRIPLRVPPSVWTPTLNQKIACLDCGFLRRVVTCTAIIAVCSESS
ncbi:MAG: hypothetical protein AABO41_28500 [Acidobacteriota bacterium]